MTKREKNGALAKEKTKVDGGKRGAVEEKTSILRTRRAFLALVWAGVGTAFLSGEVGCVRGRKTLLRQRKKNEVVNRLSQTETTLCVDGRVERMEIAKNSKRILVKLRDVNDSGEDAYFDFFASGGVRKAGEETNDRAVLELWNVEFLEARREAFDATDPIDVRSAVFDDAGTRVFWTTCEIERNGTFAASSEGGSRNDKNASAGGFRGFASNGAGDASQNGGTKIALASATTAAESANFNVESAGGSEASVFVPAA